MCALFLPIFLTSCKTYPHWYREQVCSCNLNYRLSYESCDPFVQLTVEIIQSDSGLRMYVNTFSRPLTSSQISVTVGEASLSFSGYLLEGQQRLLLPDEARDWILSSLLEDNCVQIRAGPYQATISPAKLATLYP